MIDDIIRGHYEGYFNPSIAAPILSTWNSLPVIHDRVTRKYLVVFTEEQFESLIKHQEDVTND